MRLNLLKTLNENFRIKVFAAIALFIFVISVSFTSLFIHNQIKALTDNLTKDGKILASVLAYNSRIGVFSENKELLEGPAEGIFQQEGVVEVLIFNLDGELLKSKERSRLKILKKSIEKDEQEKHKLFEKMRESISPFYLEGKSYVKFWAPVISSPGHLVEESMLFVKDPLQKNDRPIGFVSVTMDKEMLNKQFNDILFKSILMGIIFLIIGSGATYVVLKGITKPLNRLTESVKIFGKEGVVEEVPVETGDEIGELAKAFNNMAESLKRRETALRESETRYRTLFENMMEGFVYCRMLFEDGRPLDFVCLVVNDAFQTLTGFNDVVGKKVSDVIPGIREADPELFDRFARVALTGRPERFEFYVTAMNMWFDLSVYSPMKEYFVVVFDDITKRKLSEADLLKSQKLESIGILAGGIAHDFNNILFPIMGFAEMALDDVPKNSSLHDSINEIIIGVKRASDLVKQILLFSRQSNQKPKPIKIQLIVKEVLKLIRASLPTTIEIKYHISEDCGMVIADATQIYQVAMNLMTNAFHAMEDEGGVLEVTLKEVELTADDLTESSMAPGPYACITVEDSGIGIDPHVIDRIFDPYFTTKEIGKGTGLGLAVVQGIVKSCGGDIKVYSEQGKGSAFHVYLPVIKSQFEIEETKNITPVNRGTERILLVDDEASIVHMQKQMLERLGYDVTVRTSSPDALDAFCASPDKFDIVISDMTMPNMTGIRLAQKLLEIRPDIPIIISTGFSTKIDIEKAKEFGIRGYITKPVVMNELGKIIRKVLDV